MPVRLVPAEETRSVLDFSLLGFASTEEVAPLDGIASQDRALSAMEFGLDVRKSRFHVVVVGSAGTGRTFSARRVAERLAKTRPTPDDLLLLPNLERPSEPTVLTLPAGEGKPFATAMEDLHSKLVDALRGVTEGERYKQVRVKIRRRVTQEEAVLERELKAAATELGYEVSRSESEMQVVPMEDAPSGPSTEGLREITALVEDFETRLATVQDEADVEMRGTVKQLLDDAVRGCFQPFLGRFEGRPDIVRFLGDLESVVNRELRLIVDEPRGDEAPMLSRGIVVPTLLTEHEPGSGAPVVEVPFPTLGALFGRSHSPPDSEFPPEPGFAVAGALHQANGGFLILPAGPLMRNEALYEQLKACLLSGRFLVPDHNPSYYRGTAEELFFPPTPLDLKVVLVASPHQYHELYDADPEFGQLFKVLARFDLTIPLAQAITIYPSFLSGIARTGVTPHFSKEAVVELLFHGGRLIESQKKVTARLGVIAEVATEAGYRARKEGRGLVSGDDVLFALASAERRSSHYRDEMQELLADGTIRIETTGERVGQVNAIAVLNDGPVMFGRPCRVTAVTFAGFDGPVNIAREVEMSGPLHSKGVLTLTGYLAARFARTRPLSFGASLVFEQTYEAIDGDSASSSELYALLSALSGYPIRQDLAVTGAVDQKGNVQSVGGINEKIEAFFDVCQSRGLTRKQGVLIPASNRSALMLRGDVLKAIEEGAFSIYEVKTVEDGIELLTGIPAGEVDVGGRYPRNTVFAAVAAQLARFFDAVMAGERG